MASWTASWTGSPAIRLIIKVVKLHFIEFLEKKVFSAGRDSNGYLPCSTSPSPTQNKKELNFVELVHHVGDTHPRKLSYEMSAPACSMTDNHSKLQKEWTVEI
ncbi:hypothetical protein SAY87_002647 [Trapa incisa]|uniref:Uncharacterized protein n=1 Tax=Trapa incisa TaxID=236973 RepID=A0AAN7JUD3_9MYRT|nr:hypothetical protein SAY87_002647 [Trapa incisa]